MTSPTVTRALAAYDRALAAYDRAATNLSTERVFDPNGASFRSASLRLARADEALSRASTRLRAARR